MQTSQFGQWRNWALLLQRCHPRNSVGASRGVQRHRCACRYQYTSSSWLFDKLFFLQWALYRSLWKKNTRTFTSSWRRSDSTNKNMWSLILFNCFMRAVKVCSTLCLVYRLTTICRVLQWSLLDRIHEGKELSTNQDFTVRFCMKNLTILMIFSPLAVNKEHRWKTRRLQSLFLLRYRFCSNAHYCSSIGQRTSRPVQIRTNHPIKRRIHHPIHTNAVVVQVGWNCTHQ